MVVSLPLEPWRLVSGQDRAHVFRSPYVRLFQNGTFTVYIAPEEHGKGCHGRRSCLNLFTCECVHWTSSSTTGNGGSTYLRTGS